MFTLDAAFVLLTYSVEGMRVTKWTTIKRFVTPFIWKHMQTSPNYFSEYKLTEMVSRILFLLE